jgi:HK97 family phage prohead protease
MDDKAIARRRVVTVDPFATPSVSEVHESADGTGLEVSGWFATFHMDSENEAFLPHAFDAAIPAAMAAGLPVLHHHVKTEAPIGFVKSIEVKPAGLWGTAILPKPALGTKAFDLYEAVKSGLLHFWSVGGVWARKLIGGRVKLMCDRLIECSLTSCPANVNAQTAGVASVVGVKAIGGVWIPDDFDSRWDAAVAEHLQRRIDLVGLQLSVAAIRSRR